MGQYKNYNANAKVNDHATTVRGSISKSTEHVKRTVISATPYMQMVLEFYRNELINIYREIMALKESGGLNRVAMRKMVEDIINVETDEYGVQYTAVLLDTSIQFDTTKDNMNKIIPNRLGCNIAIMDKSTSEIRYYADMFINFHKDVAMARVIMNRSNIPVYSTAIRTDFKPSVEAAAPDTYDQDDAATEVDDNE